MINSYFCVNKYYKLQIRDLWRSSQLTTLILKKWPQMTSEVSRITEAINFQCKISKISLLPFVASNDLRGRI